MKTLPFSLLLLSALTWPVVAGQQASQLVLQPAPQQPLLKPTAEALDNLDVTAGRENNDGAELALADETTVLTAEQLVEQQRAAQQLQLNVAYCAPCHGETGFSSERIYPDLAAQPVDYLFSQLQAYKHRQRKNDIKQVMMLRFSDEDLLALAQYYSQFADSEQQ